MLKGHHKLKRRIWPVYKSKNVFGKAINSLSKFIDQLQIDDLDETVIIESFIRKNLTNLRFASLFVIVVSIIHIIVFQLHLDASNAVMYSWQIKIIASHIALVVVFSMCFLCINYIDKRKHLVVKSGKIISFVIFLFILFIGSIIALADQKITPAITPFMIGNIVAPFLLLIPPVYAGIAFLSNFLMFYFMLPAYQANLDILFSNTLNATTLVFLGIFLSLYFWRSNLRRCQQKQIIFNQQTELEEKAKLLAINVEDKDKVIDQRNKLFSIIAHDLRSPFNSLIGASELLVHDNLLSEEVQKKLKINLYKTSLSTFFLLENLLEWSRLQRKTTKAILKHIDLQDSIHQVLAELKLFADAKEIRIERKVLPITIEADETMISSVIRNILSNALKFSYRKGVVDIKMLTPEAGKVWLVIRDEGVGMAPETLDKLFNSNKINGKPGTENEPSVGLGLIICKEFVLLNNGQMWIKSTPDTGTTVYVELPAMNQN